MNEPTTYTEPRIGVIICECGDQIGSVLDIKRIIKAAAKLPHVEYVDSNAYPCMKAYLAGMKAVVDEQNLDRIVVAGCTYRTHGQFIRGALAEAGFNRSLIELVDIREGCSLVHADEKKRATEKAVDLIRMGVARILKARPREKVRGTVDRSAVVIGGGISGMTAALSLAKRDIPVTLMEKENRLGGLVHQMYLLYPTYTDARDFISERIRSVEEHRGIDVLLEADITHISGHTGDYQVTVEQKGNKKSFKAGVIVLATGSDVFEPVGMFGYGRDPRVVTQLTFESSMREDTVTAEHILMIQCVGARIEERPYCSRHCCLASIMNAISLKERHPGKQITVLFRGLTEHIDDFDRAQELGVRFIRYDPPAVPRVEDGTVTVIDAKTGKEHALPYDLVVLATPLVPRITSMELARMVRIPVDEWGFLVEPQTKLRPGEHTPSGVFVAGAAHWPAIISECIEQGHGAAGRATVPIEAGIIEKEPVISSIDPEQCRGCGRCADACPFHAIELETGEDGMVLARSDDFLCTGCGVCAAVCICGAISMYTLLDGQMNAALEAAVQS